MTIESEIIEPRYWRYPARILGCLRAGEITVIVCPVVGLADGGQPDEIPAQMIPNDLRMPNSEFDLLFDRAKGNFIQVLRKEENFPGTC